MPISFIICGLMFIYLLFDRELAYRPFYMLFLSLFLIGFFTPVFHVGNCYINVVLFCIPILVSGVIMTRMGVKHLLLLFAMLTVTLLEYLLLVKMRNDFSLTVSSAGLLLVAVNTIFISKNLSLPFTALAVSLLEIVSLFYYNPNKIAITLGSIESINFMLLNVLVFAMLNMVFIKIWRRKYEKVY